MMKLKRLLAALLALLMVLMLAACGGDTASDKKEDPAQSESPSPSASQTQEAESVNEEEVIAFYQEKLAGYTQQIAGLDPDEVVMTVNGEEITAELFLYWLTYDCMYWDYMSRSMYGSSLDFDAESSYGLTYREYLLEDATQLLVNYVVLRQHAVEEGVLELTTEQLEEWETQKAEYIAKNGEIGYAYLLSQSGMDEELWTDIQTVDCVYDNVCAALNPDPTEEEMEMYIKQKDLLRAKHILIRTAKDGDNGTIMYKSDGTVVNDVDGNPYQGGADKYNAEALAKANDICAQLQAASSPLALFDELMVFSEDPGSQSNPDGYDFTAGQMVEEFEEATRALEYGEISEPVESDFGYHVILRLKPEVTEDYLTETMNLYLNSWMYNAEVKPTELFEKLDTKVIYENYVAYQEELLAKKGE